MPPVKAAQKIEPTITNPPRIQSEVHSSRAESRSAASDWSDYAKLDSSKLRPVQSPTQASRRHTTAFQARVPAITGEISFRGVINVDGLISGQLGAGGGGLTTRQRPRNVNGGGEPELDGEIHFKDMLRVNGHIAGRIFSEKGTLIVATEARVDAEIDVGVAVISGKVNGRIVARERVELSPGAVVIGDISTASLAIRPGAFLDGNCCFIENRSAENKK